LPQNYPHYYANNAGDIGYLWGFSAESMITA